MPDGLMSRVRKTIARRNMTFRALVVDALEKELQSSPSRFTLRDASVGKNNGALIDVDAVNREIDAQRAERLPS